MRGIWRVTLAMALAGTAVGPLTADPPNTNTKRPPPVLKQYLTRYYVIYSDLPADDVREAMVRVTSMADEYYRQTKGFIGRVNDRWPLYIYSDPEDYYAGGGPKGTNGCIGPKGLMAIGGARASDDTWRVVQHEGFHQFAENVISNRIPVWLEEGLAEYFGAAIFTGDSFVFGVIWPEKRMRVQWAIKSKGFRPLDQFMQITSPQWQGSYDYTNYVHAWSFAHFLLHGQDGKYHKPLMNFLGDLNHGLDWKTAWKNRFGTRTDELEKQWSEWWLAQSRNATSDIYGKAMAATLTSYFGRAIAQKQAFETMEEFYQAVEAGELKCAPSDWLPPTLLKKRLVVLKWYGQWSIVQEADKLPYLRCDLRKNQGTIVCRFSLTKDGHVEKIDVQIKVTKAAATQPSSQPGAN